MPPFLFDRDDAQPLSPHIYRARRDGTESEIAAHIIAVMTMWAEYHHIPGIIKLIFISARMTFSCIGFHRNSPLPFDRSPKLRSDFFAATLLALSGRPTEAVTIKPREYVKMVVTYIVEFTAVLHDAVAVR